MNEAMVFTRKESQVKLQDAVFIDIDRQMEACDFAVALRQRGECFHTVLVAQLDGQLKTVDMLHQGGNRKSVAGAQPDGPVVAQHAFCQFGFQFG